MMNNERIEGMTHQVKGALKEGLGTLIGDSKLATDGATERASGQAQAARASRGEQVAGIDTDRLKGIGHQLRGTLKAGLGNLLGNPQLEADGVAEQGAGRAQNAAGSARDTARATAHEPGHETFAAGAASTGKDPEIEPEPGEPKP